MDEPNLAPNADSPTPPTPAPPTPPATPAINATAVDQMRAEAAAETERIAAVRRICAGRAPRLEAQSIREGWSEQRTEL